jgi:AsmA family protein
VPSSRRSSSQNERPRPDKARGGTCEAASDRHQAGRYARGTLLTTRLSCRFGLPWLTDDCASRWAEAKRARQPSVSLVAQTWVPCRVTNPCVSLSAATARAFPSTALSCLIGPPYRRRPSFQQVRRSLLYLPGLVEGPHRGRGNGLPVRDFSWIVSVRSRSAGAAHSTRRREESPLRPVRLARIALGLVGSVLVIAAVAALMLARLDLRSTIEGQASKTLDRRLTIGALQVGWGFPLSLRARELRLANAPWGSEPDMARIASLSAEIDVWPLLRGVLQLRKLEIAGFRLLLERDAEGLGNWRFKSGGMPAIGHLAVIPKNRAQFPTLIDGRLHDGEIVLRNRRGGALTIGLQQVGIGSPDGESPVSATAAGAYNGRAAQLTARTDSFAALRDPTRPFRTRFAIATAGARFDFDGTIMELLHFDGVDGAAKLEADRISALASFAGADLGLVEPLRLAGGFTRRGDHWRLSRATGKLANVDLAGSLDLHEGRLGTPDKVAADLDLAEVDLDRLLAGGPGPVATSPVTIALPQHPDPEIAGHVHAAAVRYGAVHIEDLQAQGALDERGLRLEGLGFGLAGGSVDVAGTARTAGGKTALSARATVAAADLARLALILGAGAKTVGGRLDGGMTIEMTGATIWQALASSAGHAVLVATGGRIARDLIKKALTDLLSLFREAKGTIPVSCLLGIVELWRGIANIRSFTLRSAEGTLFGTGKIDLLRRRVDLLIRPDPGTTEFPALGLPLHISGDSKDLSVQPLLHLPPILSAIPATDSLLRRLPPALRHLAERKPCQ